MDGNRNSFHSEHLTNGLTIIKQPRHPCRDDVHLRPERGCATGQHEADENRYGENSTAPTSSV